jgi:hypothetical protein
MLSSKMATRTVQPRGRTIRSLDSPHWWRGRSVCVGSVRVPSFLRGLLPKTANLARDTDCNESRPPLSLYIYIYVEDYDRLNMNNGINNQFTSRFYIRH